MANAPLIATTANPNITPSGLGSVQNPTSFTSATDPAQTLALPQTPAAPPPQTSTAALMPFPTELQGMPISPAPSVGLNNQQQQQGGITPAQAEPLPPQAPPNQTMMLAATKKAAEDRRLAQIAAYNQNRR